jgi:hypothetical protein
MSTNRKNRPAATVVAAGFGLVGTWWAASNATNPSRSVQFLADAALPAGLLAILVGAVLAVAASFAGPKPARHAAANPPPAAPAEPKTRTARSVRDLGRGGKIAVAVAVAVIGIAMMVLIALGLIGSFFTIRDLVHPTFGKWSWTVPAVLDVGAVILIAGSWLAAFIGFAVWWLGPATVGWLSGTVALNFAAAHKPGGPWYDFDFKFAIAHVAMPGAVILFTEFARALLSRWAKITIERPASEWERYPLTDWVFSTWATFWKWRRRRLWRIPKLADADAAETRYALAKGQIRRQYGTGKFRLVNWRWKAPGYVTWALRHDRLPDREIRRIGAAVGADLFGDVLANITGTPRPDVDPPPLEPPPSRDRRELPPPNPTSERRRPPRPNGNGNSTGDVAARLETAYAFYVTTVQQDGREPSGTELMEPLGITNDGRARHRRNEFRTRFEAEHGYNPADKTGQNGHAPAAS